MIRTESTVPNRLVVERGQSRTWKPCTTVPMDCLSGRYTTRRSVIPACEISAPATRRFHFIPASYTAYSYTLPSGPGCICLSRDIPRRALSRCWPLQRSPKRLTQIMQLHRFLAQQQQGDISHHAHCESLQIYQLLSVTTTHQLECCLVEGEDWTRSTR